MNKFLVAIALVTAFSAPAFAASEKVPSLQRQLGSTSEHRWQMPGHSRSDNHDDSYWQRAYWQPCNSTFHSYIVNMCDG
jgi:hypothetical protein